jgi:hypothetical protein
LLPTSFRDYGYVCRLSAPSSLFFPLLFFSFSLNLSTSPDHTAAALCMNRPFFSTQGEREEKNNPLKLAPVGDHVDPRDLGVSILAKRIPPFSAPNEFAEKK